MAEERYYIPDTLYPHGDYPIVDINYVKGGIHYVDTEKDLPKYNEDEHACLITHGMLCHVAKTDDPEKEPDGAYYSFDFEIKDWVKSRIGKDNMFSCTIDGVKQDEKSVANGLGTLPSMTRADLEGKTVNQILSQALFKEQMPFFTTPTTISAGSFITGTPKIEVNTVINPSLWSKTSGITYKYGYDTAGNTISGLIVPSNPQMDNLSQKAQIGSNKGAYVTLSYSPVLNDLNDYSFSTWGKRYKAPDPIDITGKYYGYYTGYYTIFYGYSGSEEGKQHKIKEEKLLLNTITKITSKITTSVGNITSVGQLAGDAYISCKRDALDKFERIIKIGADHVEALGNTAFVYMLIPESLNIKQVWIRNSGTSQYDQYTSNRFGILNNIKISRTADNGNELYKYNLWYIAKGDVINEDTDISSSRAPFAISLA